MSTQRTRRVRWPSAYSAVYGRSQQIQIQIQIQIQSRHGQNRRSWELSAYLVFALLAQIWRVRKRLPFERSGDRLSCPCECHDVTLPRPVYSMLLVNKDDDEAHALEACSLVS